MKILIVASNMVHINNFHLPYINAFKEAGHSVYVMARGEGADFDVPFRKKALSFANYRLTGTIRKVIKENSFDVIFLHTSLASFWARYALKGLKERPKIINVVHGYLFGKTSSRLHNFLYLRLEKKLRRQTDNIIVMNNEDYEIAVKHKLSKNGVLKIDGMGFKPLALKYEPKNQKNIVFVGEISKRKNQELLIKALEYLPNYNLTLVGDGNLRKKIKKIAGAKKVADRVQITGFQKDIASYLANADIYASASKIEGLPFNILEAMSIGMPILASDIKGHNDILPKECLFKLGNARGLANKIKQKTLNCQKYNFEPYTFENVFKENMEIFNNLIN